MVFGGVCTMPPMAHNNAVLDSFPDARKQCGRSTRIHAETSNQAFEQVLDVQNSVHKQVISTLET